MGFVIAKQLQKKDWCGYFGRLDYTLRALPNHPQALRLMGEFLNEHPPCYDTGQSRTLERPGLQQQATALPEGRWQERNGDFYLRRALRYMM
jgi:hypothetical protein